MLKNRKNNKEMKVAANNNNKTNTKHAFGFGLAVGALVGGCSVFATSKILEKRANIIVEDFDEDFDFDEDYNDEDDDFVDSDDFLIDMRNKIHDSFRGYAVHLATNSRKISVNEVLEYIESNLEPLFEKISVDDTLRTTLTTEIRAYDEIKRRLEALSENIILDDDFNPTSIPRLLDVDLPDDPADAKRLKIRGAGFELMSGLCTYSRRGHRFDNYIKESVQETKNFIATIAAKQYNAGLDNYGSTYLKR